MSLSTDMPTDRGQAGGRRKGKAPAPSTKYLFEVSFDGEADPAGDEPPAPVADAAPEPEGPPPIPPATFSEDDLVQACAAARAEGEEAGRQIAAEAFDAQANRLLEALLAQINDLVARQRDADGDLARQSVEIAIATARKCLPQMARRGGLMEIEDMVREILGGMLDEPRVVIRVADSVLDDLRARIDAIGQRLGFQGSVVLLSDPDMGPADCRVDWADGGAERIARNVWDDIDAAVKRAFDDGAPAMPPTPPGDPT